MKKTPEIVWVEEFTGVAKQSAKKAEINQKRGQIIGAVTLDLDLARGTLGGFDFKMTRKPDSSIKSRIKAKLGMEDTMDSLTGSGDAMNEIDTFHDMKDLMSIDPETGKKAQQALELVSTAAQNVDTKMQALLCEEAGLTPAEIEALEEAYQQRVAYNKRADVISARRNKVPPPKMDPELAVDPKKLETFKDIRGKVDQTVRDEVWMPMVREGVMPENLVPDRQSEVARTFEGASDAYNDRLDEYTKSLGDNDEALKTLGIAKKVVDLGVKAAQEAIKLAGASVPVDQIEKAVTLFKITEATAFTVAEQIIKKEDAASFLDTALKAAKQIVDTVVPEGVAIFVDAGLDIAMTGSKAIKAVMAGSIDDFLAAVADGITQSLGVADAARGTNDLAPLGSLVAGAVRQAAAGAKLAIILKTKPFDEKAFKAAMATFIQASMKEIGSSITMVVEAETSNIKGGKSTVAKIDKGVAIGSEGVGALLAAGLSDDPLADVTKALGDIASKSCEAFMDPRYGKTVGAALKSGLADGAGKFLPALVRGDPEAALKALGDMVATGVEAAAGAKTLSPGTQDALGQAAGAIRAFVATCDGANDLRKAIVSKDPAAVEKALKKIMNAVGSELSAELITKADDDDADASEDEDAGGDEDADGEDDSGKELAPGAEKKQTELLDSLKEIIKKADEIIAAGTPPDKVAKAKEAKAKATKEMVQQATLKSAFEAESSAFAAQLAESFGGDQEDDEAQTKTLKELILKLQRDRKIFEMVNSLLDMGIAAAAQLFPPMGAALDFKKFTVEVGMAVMHAKALLEWKRNADEAKNAVTVQAHAMLNRVGLEEDAVIEHNIKASLALVSAIGQVIATVGAHAAPVGVAMSGAAKLGGILLEAALLVKSEAELKAAWSIYQKALKEPRDRKVVRMALQTNSSLAKYAMVWGAQKDNNPIAKKVLKRCGVTAKMLEKEQGDSQQIVAYLEELFHDDPIVLRATPDMTGWGWEAPPPKLTLRGWTDFLSVAQGKGKPKMKSGTGGRMTGIMASLDKAVAAYKKAEMDLTKAKAFLDKLQALNAASADRKPGDPTPGEDRTAPVEDKATLAIRARIDKAVALVGTTSLAYQAALQAVVGEGKAFKPIDEDDKPYPRLVEYMDAVAALAELEIKKLAGETVAVDLAA